MKQKVEFIESYIKVGNDYQWNDNHGELIRCKDCTHQHTNTITGMKQCLLPNGYTPLGDDNDYCSYAERKPPQVNPKMVKALLDRIEKQRGEDA